MRRPRMRRRRRSAAPRRVTEDDDARSVGQGLVRRERPSDRGRHAEHLKVVLRDLFAENRLGIAHAGQRGSPSADGGQRRKQGRLGSPVHEVARRRPLSRRTAARAHVLPDHHEPIGSWIRQRLHEQPVHHRKHRRGRADAKGDRQHRRRRKRRCSPKHAEGVPNVSNEGLEAEAAKIGHVFASLLSSRPHRHERGETRERLTPVPVARTSRPIVCGPRQEHLVEIVEQRLPHLAGREPAGTRRENRGGVIDGAPPARAQPRHISSSSRAPAGPGHARRR